MLGDQGSGVVGVITGDKDHDGIGTRIESGGATALRDQCAHLIDGSSIGIGLKNNKHGSGPAREWPRCMRLVRLSIVRPGVKGWQRGEPVIWRSTTVSSPGRG